MSSEIVKSPEGLKWHVGGAETDDHLALGGHEPALRPVLESLCSPDKAYVNVGAHVGTWALRMADHAALVYAVEANANTWRRLNENVELNELEDKVFPICAAAWDEPNVGIHLVDVNGKETGGSTRAEAVVGGTSLTTTLDILFADGALPVGLISTDVEGAEARVLAGAEKIIMRDRPNLLIELHEGHPGTDLDLREQVEALLEKYDYEWESIFISSHEEYLRGIPKDGSVDFAEPEVVKAGE